MAVDNARAIYGPESGPLESPTTHHVAVTPDDDHNLPFLTTGIHLNADVSAVVALIDASGATISLQLRPGINQGRFWRVLETGTTLPEGASLVACDSRTPSAAPAETPEE